MTLVNLTSLFLLVIAIRTDNGEKLLPHFDPTDPVSFILSNDETGEDSDLRSATANSSMHSMPWETPVVFGKNKDGAYRIRAKDKVWFILLLVICVPN